MRWSGPAARDRRGTERRASKGWHHLIKDGSCVCKHRKELGEHIEAGGCELGEIFKVARTRVARTGALPGPWCIGAPLSARRLSAAGVFLSQDRLRRMSKVAVAVCVGAVKQRGNDETGRTY